MANIFAYQSFNIYNIDLNYYVRNLIDAQFLNNANVSINGKNYSDVYAVLAGPGYELYFGGPNINVNANLEVLGGTVTGILEYDPFTAQFAWAAEGISVSALAIYNSAFTASNSDELALVAAALSRNDRIELSPEADVMNGFNGNDILIGHGGNDFLGGGAGNDRLVGGSGNDVLRGQSGDDRLIGSAGNDRLIGGDGNDKLIGHNGVDTAIYSDSGSGVRVSLAAGTGAGGTAAGDTLSGIENVTGSSFNDVLIGDGADNRFVARNGNDSLSGRGGNDLLQGAGGNDVLRGHSGDDRLIGGGGNDRLFGGNGVDRLVGGGGDDVLAGGGDVDSFVFNTAAWGDDTINDFADGVEMMDMRGSGASAGTLNVVTSGTDAIVDFGTGQTITLIGQAGSIDATDFIF